MLRILYLHQFRLLQSVPKIRPPIYVFLRKLSHFKRPLKPVIPRENLLVQLKTKIDQDKGDISHDKWRDIRQQLISNSKQITLHNIDAVIISQFNEAADLEMAKNYINFLKSEGIKPNYATLGKLLRLYHMAYMHQGISNADRNDVLQIYREIRQKHDAFDATTCENLIFGLLTTDLWRDSLELFKMIKLSASPSINVYSGIISKLFHTGEISLGWELLREMIEARKQPKCEVFIAYIQYASKDQQTFVNSIVTLFDFLGKYEILISQFVVEELRKCLETQGLPLSLATLNKNGKCSNCHAYMKNISISDKEFNALKSSFLERVLIRKDVFQKSTPEELNRFIKFVDETGPYDCVIDGLNVAYSCGVKKGPKVFVHLLSSVVGYFQKQNKYVLVLGRKHMNRWPKEGMNFVRNNARLFLANDLSHDDPFLLYATIKSGQATDFFSRDLMRSHAFLLGTELKSIFRRWQQEHQYALVTANDMGKVVIKEPIRHIKFAHEVNSTWHIPYKESYSPNPAEVFEVPSSWLCIKLNK